jgi:HK97 family phage major capsid protein
MNLTNEVESFLTEAKTTIQNQTERLNKIECDLGRPPRGPIGDQDTPNPADKILRKSTAPTDSPRLGAVLKGIVLGDWSEAEAEKRAIGGSSDAVGGVLLPTDIAQEVIDFSRAASVCMSAGARTLLMDTGNLRIPRLTSDPVGTWKPENDYLMPTNISFEAVDFKAHTLVASLRCSVELFEDSRLVNEIMISTLTKALGLQLDQAILRGSGVPVAGSGPFGSGGSNAPMGIRFTPGVNLVPAAANAGTAITRELISSACETIWDANGNPNACVMSPREMGILDRLKDTLYQPLRSFPSYDQLSKHVTTSLSTTLPSLATPPVNNTSELFVGDFSEIIVGIRTGWTVEASRGASEAFDRLQVAVRIYGRYDIGLMHPAHFVVLQNLSALSA